jgi:hypothetical protein
MACVVAWPGDLRRDIVRDALPTMITHDNDDRIRRRSTMNL